MASVMHHGKLPEFLSSVTLKLRNSRAYPCFYSLSRGEVSVLASQRRRNQNKDVHTETVARGHMADMLCLYEQHEFVCGLACGGPHLHDLSKLSSDEFSLARMMKDMLD